MSPFTRVFCYAVVVLDVMAVVYFGARFITTGSIIPHDKHPEILVASVKEASKGGETQSTKPKEPEFDVASYVADVVAGQKVAGACKACHTFDNGGPNRTGPNLWGIFGADIAYNADFSYSSAFLAKKGEIVWNDETLNEFLRKPKSYISGTKMAYNGINDKKIKDRLDLIAYLKTLK